MSISFEETKLLIYWSFLLRTIDVQTCMSSNVEPSHFGEEQLHRFPKWSQQQQGEGPQPPKDACNLQRNRTFFNNNCWLLWNILAFSHFHWRSSFNILFQLKTSFRSYTLCIWWWMDTRINSLSETIPRKTWLNINMYIWYSLIIMLAYGPTSVMTFCKPGTSGPIFYTSTLKRSGFITWNITDDNWIQGTKFFASARSSSNASHSPWTSNVIFLASETAQNKTWTS